MGVDTHTHWMQQALDQAKIAGDNGEVPVGAVVVLHDRIIGYGYNRRIIDSDPSAHAELIALRMAAKTINNYRLVDCSLYVTLEPCLMCYGAIVESRLKQVVFGANDNKQSNRAALIKQDRRINHQFELIEGVHQDACEDILQEFFQAKRRNTTHFL